MINLKVIAPEDLPSIKGRLEMVEQILENLVSNAIKYTPSNGSVDVKFYRNVNQICIEVKDTGIGIRKNDREKLFTEFFRAANAKAVEKNGTGLGLAIVKELVNNIGGWILVESEEGLGSIFVIYLPIAGANGQTNDK
jgi:signal transduction histidine kinase